MANRERPAEFAILGLLYFDDRGGHGYDLARHFGPDQPLGEVLRLESGMLYHHLKRLERGALVSSTPAKEGSRPQKQVYQVTERGRVELRRWMQSPVGHTREIRLEFLVKLFFARQLDPELANRLVQTQLDTLRTLLQSLQERQGQSGRSTEDGGDAFGQEVVALRTAQTAAAIAWLEGLPVRPGSTH